MKKVLVLIIIFSISISFIGCKARQGKENNATNQDKRKIVLIDSEPQGATVYIDNNLQVITPIDIELTLGLHRFLFRKDGYFDIIKDIEIKEDTTKISITLKKLPSEKDLEELAQFAASGPIIFDSVPHFACCSRAAISYSNIFYGGTYTISGKTTLNSFDIIFPSGKKVHFDTEKISDYVRKFSKIVKFDELGTYKIVSDDSVPYLFDVDYKPTILPPTKKLEDIFSPTYKNAIAVPIGSEVEAKVLITDIEGKPIPNTSLGVYGLKTDENGVVKFKVKVERVECSYCYKIYVNGVEGNVRIYGDLLIWGYDYAKYTKNGELIYSTTQNANVTLQPSLLPEFKDKIEIFKENNEIYMPFDSIGVKLNEIYKNEVLNNIILVSQKDPQVLYTNSFVSKDGGEHFEKLGMSFDAIAVDPKNPNIILGWSRNEPNFIFKSNDFGLHFEKISFLDINLNENFVEQIVFDPNNSNKVYFATCKGLYLSVDQGKTFSLITNDFGIVSTIAICPNDSNIILLGTQKGIVKSSDCGKTWKIVKNYNNDIVECIIFNDGKKGNYVFAGSLSDGLLVSYDYGDTWKNLYKFELEGHQTIVIFENNDSFIIYVASFRDGIYKSVDFGKTFTKIDFPVGSFTTITKGEMGKIYIIDDGIPFVKDDVENILPLDGNTFLKDGPKWKIINNKLYIDVSDIKGENIGIDIKWEITGIKVNNDYIEFYVMCNMLP